MPKRLLAIAASAAVFTIGAAVPTGQAGAQLAPYGVRGLDVTITPSAYNLEMLNAYVHGVQLGAFYTCAELGYGGNNIQFGDCYWILGTEWGYSQPIEHFWTGAYGRTTDWQWDVPFNDFLGPYVF